MFKLAATLSAAIIQFIAAVEHPDCTPSTCVVHNGYLYRTLDGTAPSESRIECQRTYIPVPSGWFLVGGDDDGRSVAAMYTWGCHLIVHSDNTSTATLGYATTLSQWTMMQDGGGYKPSQCHVRILIRTPTAVPTTVLLFTAEGNDATYSNAWLGWYNYGSHGVAKQPAYDEVGLTRLRFQDAAGSFAEYTLTAQFTGLTLLEIVQQCMPGTEAERINDGGGTWNAGLCPNVGELADSYGVNPVASVLRIGVGDGSVDENDWALFMPLNGNGDADFVGKNAWAFGSEEEANTGYAGPVQIYGQAGPAPTAAPTPIPTTAPTDAPTTSPTTACVPVINGDFESGTLGVIPDGWQRYSSLGSTGVLVDEAAHSGAMSIYFEGPDWQLIENGPFEGAAWSLMGGATYHLTFWAKSASGNSGYQIITEFLTYREFEAISSHQGRVAGATSSYYDVTGEWTKFTHTLRPTETSNNVRMMIGLTADSPNTGRIYIDDVSMGCVEATTPTSMVGATTIPTLAPMDDSMFDIKDRVEAPTPVLSANTTDNASTELEIIEGSMGITNLDAGLARNQRLRHALEAAVQAVLGRQIFTLASTSSGRSALWNASAGIPSEVDTLAELISVFVSRGMGSAVNLDFEIEVPNDLDPAMLMSMVMAVLGPNSDASFEEALEAELRQTNGMEHFLLGDLETHNVQANLQTIDEETTSSQPSISAGDVEEPVNSGFSHFHAHASPAMLSLVAMVWSSR